MAGDAVAMTQGRRQESWGSQLHHMYLCQGIHLANTTEAGQSHQVNCGTESFVLTEALSSLFRFFLHGRTNPVSGRLLGTTSNPKRRIVDQRDGTSQAGSVNPNWLYTCYLRASFLKATLPQLFLIHLHNSEEDCKTNKLAWEALSWAKV